MILSWPPANCKTNQARGKDIQIGDWLQLGMSTWGRVRQVWVSGRFDSGIYKDWYVTVEGIYYTISLGDEIFDIARREG